MIVCNPSSSLRYLKKSIFYYFSEDERKQTGRADSRFRFKNRIESLFSDKKRPSFGIRRPFGGRAKTTPTPASTFDLNRERSTEVPDSVTTEITTTKEDITLTGFGSRSSTSPPVTSTVQKFNRNRLKDIFTTPTPFDDDFGSRSSTPFPVSITTARNNFRKRLKDIFTTPNPSSVDAESSTAVRNSFRNRLKDVFTTPTPSSVDEESSTTANRLLNLFRSRGTRRPFSFGSRVRTTR